MTLSRRHLLAGIGTAAAAGVSDGTAHQAAAQARGQRAAATGPDAHRAARSRSLAAVTSWGVQLRLLNITALAATPTDMIVIDHGFSDGIRFLRQFDRSEIELLKSKPDGSRRLVISYLSIGEAETYRWYWPEAWFDLTQRPRWIGPENPRWPGNFPVDYWEADWQRIIAGGPDSYVARIMAQGFDGLYLDRVDVYDELKARHPQGARTMSAFVARIAALARSLDPRAIVILQNAEELIAERTMRESIDAVSREDLYFGVDHTEAENTAAETRSAVEHLRRARMAGKRVFTIEYVRDPIRQRLVAERSAREGFLPYIAARDLSRLVVDPLSLAPDYRGALVPQEAPPKP